MATRNRILELLETGEATLDEAIDAIKTFEHDLASGQNVETRTCSFCGKQYVVTVDKPVVAEQGRRSVCWRRACRQELRARGLSFSSHHLYRAPALFHIRH